MRTIDIATWRRVAVSGLFVTATLATGMVIGAGSAGAASTNAQGTVTCKTVTGTITFSPGITATTTKTKMSFSLKEACVSSPTRTSVRGRAEPRKPCDAPSGWHCTTDNTRSNSYAVYHPKKFSTTVVKYTPTCVATAKWIAKNTAPSVVTFSGFSDVEVGKYLIFTFPQSGGTASGKGSYTGSNKGATSTLKLSTPDAKLAAEYASKKGITSLKVTSGLAHFG
jgi:hypothetical protein